MKKYCLCIILFFIITGCGWGGNQTDNQIVLTLTTDQIVYHANQPIAMSLVVVNQADQPEKITFSSSKEFDFWLTSGDQPVWKWSGGKMFAQSLRTITVTPGKPLIYLAVFNPANTRVDLQEGSYKITGAWTTMDKTYQAEPVMVEIRK